MRVVSLLLCVVRRAALGQHELKDKRNADENQYLRHDKADDHGVHVHRQEGRLVPVGNLYEIGEHDEHGSEKRRVDQVRDDGLDEVCLRRARLQFEGAAKRFVDLGHRHQEPDGKADDEADSETGQESDDDGCQGHLGRTLRSQVPDEREGETHQDGHDERNFETDFLHFFLHFIKIDKIILKEGECLRDFCKIFYVIHINRVALVFFEVIENAVLDFF